MKSSGQFSKYMASCPLFFLQLEYFYQHKKMDMLTYLFVKSSITHLPFQQLDMHGSYNFQFMLKCVYFFYNVY